MGLLDGKVAIVTGGHYARRAVAGPRCARRLTGYLRSSEPGVQPHRIGLDARYPIG